MTRLRPEDFHFLKYLIRFRKSEIEPPITFDGHHKIPFFLIIPVKGNRSR